MMIEYELHNIRFYSLCLTVYIEPDGKINRISQREKQLAIPDLDGTLRFSKAVRHNVMKYKDADWLRSDCASYGSIKSHED